jgi:hypothetical protein
MDMVVETSNPSDEVSPLRPCTGSPTRSKKLRTERATPSLRERTRSKIRTMFQGGSNVTRVKIYPSVRYICI